MTSQYQKKNFPVENLGKLQQITVLTPSNENINIFYPELELIFINNQLCWKHISKENEVPYMPICRKSTIDKLFEEKE